MNYLSSCCCSQPSPVLPVSAIGKDQPKTCCSRAKPYLELTPPIFLLAINVLAIALVLIYHNPYLVVPFGVGCIFSIYQIYFTYEARGLKSLGTRVEELEKIEQGLKADLVARQQQIEAAAKVNENLQTRLSEAATHVAALNDQRIQLAAQIQLQRAENQQLKNEREAIARENESLKQGVKDLKVTLEAMHKEWEAERKKFDAIAEGMGRARDVQETELRKILAEFDARNKVYMAQNQVHDALIASKKASFVDEVNSLRALCLLMQGVYSSVIQDKGGFFKGIEESIQKRTLELASITGRLEATTKHLAEREANMRATEARITALNDEYGKQNERYQRLLSRASDAVGRRESAARRLSEQANAAAAPPAATISVSGVAPSKPLTGAAGNNPMANATNASKK